MKTRNRGHGEGRAPRGVAARRGVGDASRREGVALVGVVVVLTALAIVGAVIIGVTTTSSFQRLISGDSNRAYYLAESGGAYARYLLKQDSAARPSGTFALADGCGNFVLSNVDDPGDPTRILVTSEGVINKARRRITFNMTKQQAPGGGLWDKSGDLTAQNTQNPDPSDLGFAFVNYDGSSALQVQGLRSADDFAGWLFIRESLMYVSAREFLQQSWRDANFFLSYDLQVKIATEFLSTQYSYFSGLCFRLDAAEHSYGFTLCKAHDTTLDGMPTEYIPDEWRCLLSIFGVCILWGWADMTVPMVVLWEDTADTSAAKKWLAYRIVDTTSGLLLPDGIRPKNWNTLMVRIREAPSLTCGNVSSINVNDVLTQGSARAVVAGPALYSTSPAGVLILRNLTGTFSAGSVTVNGVSTITATEFRAKENFIWAFVGDKDSATANASPYDWTRAAVPRGQWNYWPAYPVDDWTAACDRFTLIQWEASNAAAPVTHELLGRPGYPRTVVRSTSLLSPNSGALSGPQVGLHTFGWNNVDFPGSGAYRKNYYFDDFALKVDATGAGGSGYQY